MQARRLGQAGGKSTAEADQLAATTLKAKVGKQAAIVAMKDVSGSTVVLLAGAACLSLLLPYHKKETT